MDGWMDRNIYTYIFPSSWSLRELGRVWISSLKGIKAS
jgi:hypothetical protein